MTTIQPMVRVKADRIPDLMAKTHITLVDQNRPFRRPSIDWQERHAGEEKSQIPAPTAEESMPDTKIYEAIDVVSAMILNAQAGLNWLDAEKPNLERARKALNNVAGDGKRVAEIVLRLRTLIAAAAILTA